MIRASVVLLLAAAPACAQPPGDNGTLTAIDGLRIDTTRSPSARPGAR